MPIDSSSRCGILALLLAMRAGVALGAWVVDDRGDCVRRWTAASLARGPAAILNAPLAPVRSAVGGFLVARDDPSPGGRRKILLSQTLAVAGGAMGLIDGAVWLGTGLADTLTGGRFELAPDEATRLSVEPMRPVFATDVVRGARAEGSTDRCGRPVGRGPR